MNDGRARRGRAPAEVRQRAIELRRAGRTVPQIATELGVATSTAYYWVRHLPLDASPDRGAERRSRHSRAVAESRWEPYRRRRDAERAAVNDAGIDWVGRLSDREVLLIGAATYWCEGTKAKPWRVNDCQLQFINSDPALVQVFLRYVELLGGERGALRYRLSIHESADIGAATRWWAEVAGVPVEVFRPPTIKVHNASTVRLNTDSSYRGCLVIYVPRSRLWYWRTEAVMRGIAVATATGGDAKMS